MAMLFMKATGLQQELISRLDRGVKSGQNIWKQYKEMALSPLESGKSEAPADSLLITFGYQSIGRQRLTLKLVRQLLLGTDDEIIEGAQVQCLLHYEAAPELEKLVKQMKDLTRLGSWAFPSAEAYLAFAEATPALQALFTEYRPVEIEIKSENLLT